ncbi:Hint domain-containing protein [Aliiroseovarius sp. F47248L]|uniref:Hint domain-containing protein n=1 Tax=Aliiroseovarius sp. F47248L TaxID=2926420 RepID=UPI001FF59BFD|nr:Hint domain-containing protein [Aliiroseovarius sp. F47248L]MCK0139048.1 Hint domain-containing protein [Aliiroseovarius sp. F47248L]
MTPNPFSGGMVAGDVRSTPPTAGIGPGAAIHTQHGDRLIETIVPGDRIITPDGGRARVSAISVLVVPTRTLCRISPDALPEDRRGGQSNPLIVSLQQIIRVTGWLARAMFRRNQALVPVSALVDRDFVRKMTLDAELPLFQLHCETPALFCAGGLQMLATPSKQYAR